MSNEYGSDFMTIIDEDGTEYELEVLSTLEYNGETYLAVTPATDEDVEVEVSILKSVEEDGESILAVTDGGVHGDHKAGAVCVNGGDHLDAGLNIIAQLDFIPLHAGLNIYMDSTGSVLSDVNKLILRHILGGPAGQLDNKANRG